MEALDLADRARPVGLRAQVTDAVDGEQLAKGTTLLRGRGSGKDALKSHLPKRQAHVLVSTLPLPVDDARD